MEDAPITPIHCKMARAALGWGVRDLAKRAKIGQATVVRFENGEGRTNAATIAVIQAAFERAGIEFSNGDEPGVKLKRRHKPDSHN
jgi:transcriptional regulator with XRE-family HTH domain